MPAISPPIIFGCFRYCRPDSAARHCFFELRCFQRPGFMATLPRQRFLAAAAARRRARHTPPSLPECIIADCRYTLPATYADAACRYAAMLPLFQPYAIITAIFSRQAYRSSSKAAISIFHAFIFPSFLSAADISLPITGHYAATLLITSFRCRRRHTPDYHDIDSPAAEPAWPDSASPAATPAFRLIFCRR